MQSCLRGYGKRVFKKNRTIRLIYIIYIYQQIDFKFFIFREKEKREKKRGIMRQRFNLFHSN